MNIFNKKNQISSKTNLKRTTKKIYELKKYFDEMSSNEKLILAKYFLNILEEK